MSRTGSLFVLLLLLLCTLLYIYQFDSARYLLKLSHKDKTLAKLSISDVLSSLSSDNSFVATSSEVELDSFDNSPGDIAINTTKVEGPVQVIVLARMRTGSTLCGEIFNQNPELFFIFEPLHSFKVLQMSEDDSLEEESTDLLKKLYKCKFPRMFIQTLARWSIGKGKSRKILPICQETDGCAKATPSQFQRVCTKSGHVVTKTIRANVKMLKPLIKFHGINLKILHLMRDPRGTASSRRSYYTPKKRGRPEGVGERSLHELGLLSTSQDSKKNTIPKLCAWMKETLKDALNKPTWLQDQYRLVRYEDLAEDPIRLSQHIYDFIGLEMPPVVLKWIHNNTESDNSRSKNQFSTRKNSSRASTSWRGRLSLEEVLAVQDICGDVMASLGYKKLYTQEELENYSLSLVEPIKLDKDLMIM